MHSITDKKLLMLKPCEINLTLCRIRKNFDNYELQLLAESIRANGIIQPLSVRRDENGRYELISGERRLKAAIMAGLRRVPCVLHKADAADVLIFSVAENLQRSELDFFEQAEGINLLITDYPISYAEASVRLGIPQSVILNKLRLLKIEPPLREKIIKNSLGEVYARSLLCLPEHSRAEVLDYIITNKLSPEQAQEYIFDRLNPMPELPVKEEPPAVVTEEKPCRKAAIGDVRLFSNSLTKLIDTLKCAGVKTQLRKSETDKYIEYKVRIIKEEPLRSGVATQLKIC